MYTVHTSEGNKLNLKGRDVTVLIGSDRVKSDRMTMGVTIVPPFGNNGMHTHDDKEEIIYVLEGTGEAIIGGETEKLEPGTAVLFPIGVPHVTNSLSRNPLKYVFIFNPINNFDGSK